MSSRRQQLPDDAPPPRQPASGTRRYARTIECDAAPVQTPGPTEPRHPGRGGDAHVDAFGTSRSRPAARADAPPDRAR